MAALVLRVVAAGRTMTRTMSAAVAVVAALVAPAADTLKFMQRK